MFGFGDRFEQPPGVGVGAPGAGAGPDQGVAASLGAVAHGVVECGVGGRGGLLVVAPAQRWAGLGAAGRGADPVHQAVLVGEEPGAFGRVGGGPGVRQGAQAGGESGDLGDRGRVVVHGCPGFSSSSSRTGMSRAVAWKGA